MIRRAAAIILALTLNPALLHAQGTTFTVTVPSADVYKGASNVTPVIGHVPRGTVLSVSRNLGGWVKIAWPDAQDGIGYVRMSMGRVDAPDVSAPVTNVSPQASSASAATTTTIPPKRTQAGGQVIPRVQGNGAPISHIFGVGALVTPMSGFGASARTWRKNHVAIQAGFTRHVMTSDIVAGRMTSMQFEPGVAYALFDRVTDYVWIRPYVGSGVSFFHQTLSGTTPLAVQPAADNGVGFRIFGGGEMTFASMPQFGVSADFGYRHVPTPFPGFTADPLSVSIAGHWYVK